MGRKFPSDVREHRRSRRTLQRRAITEAEQDALDVALVEQRMAADDGLRYSLGEVIERLGVTQEELDAIPDDAE